MFGYTLIKKSELNDLQNRLNWIEMIGVHYRNNYISVSGALESLIRGSKCYDDVYKLRSFILDYTKYLIEVKTKDNVIYSLEKELRA